MIVIRFGRWSHESGWRFIYDRIFTKRGFWTPFCNRKPRVELKYRFRSIDCGKHYPLRFRKFPAFVKSFATRGETDA